MSFKRDESHSESLHILRKRRTDELLSENIPEDEALLLKNGRFTCLVCKHRPVFDTVQILTVHRSGKKHTSNAEHFVKNKQYLADEIEKRKQQESLKHGSIISPYSQISVTQHLGLATQVSYDPRARKKPYQPNERKPVLDLGGRNTPGHTDVNALSWNKHKPKSKMAADVIVPQKNPTAKQSWQSCSSGNSSRQSFLDSSGNSSRQSFLDSSGNSSRQSFLDSSGNSSRQSFLDKDCPQTIQEYRKRNQSERAGAVMGYKRRIIEKDLAKTEKEAFEDTDSGGNSISIVYHNISTIQNTKHTPNKVFIKKEKLKKATDTKSKREPNPIDEKKQELAEKYLQLRSAGWKKNLSGKWVKDEEVEFDSDEEPPILP